MTEVTTTIRNRFDRSKETNQESTEELLIEKLDMFLSSIESRLDKFEQYFKFNNLQELEEDIQLKDNKDDTHRRRRSSSSASLQSFKSFATLDTIHQRLKLIKQSVLKSSTQNLDYLYKTLDDQYNYLFNSNESFISPDVSFDNSKEILSQKIITTLHYFDEKLIHIDDMIQKRLKTPVSTDKTIFDIFKFYNFNKALKVSQHDYLHYYQLPLGWRENRYIINGYRFSLSHMSMLRSVFIFNHNESMNIWTHLIGLGIMLYIWAYDFPKTKAFEVNSYTDNLVIYFFLSCAIACLISSSVWHTYSSFAKLATRYNCACIDYTGITVLITASVISVEYASLYNYPKLLNSIVPFTSFCGAFGLIFNWSPFFDKPECRSVRIGFFVGLAALGVVTIVILCFYEGFISSFKFFVPLFYKSFLMYWIGVVFYGGLIPERWRYDVIIDEDEFCNHEHSAAEVMSGNMENSGDEEFLEIQHDVTDQILNNSKSDSDSETENTKFNEILEKHFPENPKYTHYHQDFFSLWWVDYAFSSHNVWHIFVVLGILGHYSCIIDMFDKISR